MACLNFQQLRVHDLDELKKLQPEGWTDIIPEFEGYVQKNFCHPIKAVLDQHIVGVGTLITFGPTGWLAHIIVDKNHRNKGIGTRITEILIQDGQDKSVETLLLIATELGLPLYQKAGFRMVTAYQYFKRDTPRRDHRPSPKIIPYAAGLDAAIFKIDEETSGENRRSLLADHLGKALVYIKNNAAEGFYMPDLGEGLILARTAEAGLELMKVKYSKADKAVLPIENAVGMGFLRQHGFSLTDTKGTRMIWGKDIDWKQAQVFSRIGGNYG